MYRGGFLFFLAADRPSGACGVVVSALWPFFRLSLPVRRRCLFLLWYGVAVDPALCMTSVNQTRSFRCWRDICDLNKQSGANSLVDVQAAEAVDTPSPPAPPAGTFTRNYYISSQSASSVFLVLVSVVLVLVSVLVLSGLQRQAVAVEEGQGSVIVNASFFLSGHDFGACLCDGCPAV